MPVDLSFAFSRRHAVALGLAVAAGLLALGERAQAKRTAQPAVATPVTTPQLLLRVTRSGGLMPWEYAVTRMPDFSLFDDGSLFRLGPQIAIDPPPALPNLTLTRLTDTGIAFIMEQARQNGLAQAQALANTLVMDAPTTVFVFREETTLVKTTVGALITDAHTPPEWDEETTAHYHRLAELQAFLFGIDSHLSATDVLEPEAVIDPERLQVLVISSEEYPSLSGFVPNPDQPPIAWPLETPLATSGSTVQPGTGYPESVRCFTLAGDDAAMVVSAARTGTFASPWVDQGAQFGLLLRPLLPDETGCL